MGEVKRVRRGKYVALLLAAVLVVGAGCTKGEPADQRPQMTVDPTLAAAIDAYTRYSAAFDVVRSQPPREQDTASLEATVTDEYWTILEAELEADDRPWRQQGSSSFGHEELVETNTSTDFVRAVVIVCVDLTHTILVDADGTEMTAPGRRLVFPMQVTLEGETTSSLLVADAEALKADETCGA